MQPLPNGSMRRIPILPDKSSSVPDLLWISKHQQQHPSTYAHPLKNTVRIDSNGIRHKFDGKQWRPLCHSPDGYECRNVAFRSSLCQKHFYKINLFKRPYTKHGSHSATATAAAVGKRSVPDDFEHQSRRPSHDQNAQLEEIYDDDDDDSIELLENNHVMLNKQAHSQSQHDYSFLSIDCDTQLAADPSVKSEPSMTAYANRADGRTPRLDSTNTESIASNESDFSPFINAHPRAAESARVGLPTLTRTEEKALAQELISQLPADASFNIGEQWARRRACEIVHDNYSQRLLPTQIVLEWFYDYLLRNPRVPIHFQSWFSGIKNHLPTSDHLLEIKVWELGLVTRSMLSSSFIATPPSSSSPQ